jgi:uncharacterized membrane protein YdjX (TVP38/TMEM64 family)
MIPALYAACNTTIDVMAFASHCLLCNDIAGTLIGCAPNNFMAANAGDHLSDLDSLADLYNPKMLLLGLTVGLIALLPVYVKHRHERAMVLLAQKLR